MRFPLFDRRGKRIAKLASLLTGNADDATVKSELAKASVEELAVVLTSLPLERANCLLSHVPPSMIKAALVHLTQSKQSAESRAGAVKESDEQPSNSDGLAANDKPSSPSPVCLRALDFAGKVLGAMDESTLSKTTKS